VSLSRGPLRLGVACWLAVLTASASAQVRDPEDTLSAGERSGSISDVSRPLGPDSKAVHDGALTIGETSGGPVRSGPVRGPGTRSMLSGPVSESSRGPMTHERALRSGGSITEASAGAVKHDIAAPLGERISQPLRELRPLQERLRELHQHALTVPVEETAPAAEAAPVEDSMADMPVVHADEEDATGAEPEPPPSVKESPSDELLHKHPE
jgi:hypothetical protein